VREKKNAYGVLVGKTEGREPLGRYGLRLEVILKLIL
jgi:hypothetical protein